MLGDSRAARAASDPAMRRVVVVGCGGAGKSTFAVRLAARTGLPVVHLDAIYWKAGWQPSSPEEWRRNLAPIVARDTWILDGDYAGTLDRRLAACDTAVFLDVPRRVCLWRAIKRWLRFRGRPRPDVAAGCREQLSREFVRWIWAYPATQRPQMLARLASLGPGQRGVILRSRADVERFLREAPAAPSPH
jgi:adenylate kinase family enzyme